MWYFLPDFENGNECTSISPVRGAVKKIFIPSTLQLHIEKLVYGGDGLARLPADEQGQGKAVFAPFVIPGEKVEASPVETRPGFVRAELDKVLTPSQERIAPGCPYFERCGGCHYQHISYDAQLRYKAEILRETSKPPET